MSSYEVGTVLWIIHEDRPGLMAYRVVEEITKKTLEGEQIRYLIQVNLAIIIENLLYVKIKI